MRIDVPGSYRAELRDALAMRHRYEPSSPWRTRMRNRARRVICKLRILATPDLRPITHRYFSDFEDPDVINTGWCYVWAWLAKLRHPEAQLVIYDEFLDGHACVRIGGFYYDSSQPLGVRDISRLAWFDGVQASLWNIEIVSPEQFRAFRWNRVDEHFATQGLVPWPTKLPRLERGSARERR